MRPDEPPSTTRRDFLQTTGLAACIGTAVPAPRACLGAWLHPTRPWGGTSMLGVSPFSAWLP